VGVRVGVREGGEVSVHVHVSRGEVREHVRMQVLRQCSPSLW